MNIRRHSLISGTAVFLMALASCSTEVDRLRYDDSGISSARGVQLLRDPPLAGEYHSLGEHSYSFYRPGFREPTIGDVWDDLSQRVRSTGSDACLIKYQYVSTWTARSIDVTCEVLKRKARASEPASVTGAPAMVGAPVNAPAPGKYSYAAEHFAQDQRCVSQRPPSLMVAGSGFETYSVACTVGEPLLVRCDFGNCRALR